MQVELDRYVATRDADRIMKLPLIDQISIIIICNKRDVIIDLLKILWRRARAFKIEYDKEIFNKRGLIMKSDYYRYNPQTVIGELKLLYSKVRDLRIRGLVRYLYSCIERFDTPTWTWDVDQEPLQVEEIYTYLKFKYIVPGDNRKVGFSYMNDLYSGIAEAYSTIDSDIDDFVERMQSDPKFMVENVTKMIPTVTYNAVSCLNMFEAMVKFLNTEDLIESIMYTSPGSFEFIRGVLMGRVIKYGTVDKKLYKELYEAGEIYDKNKLQNIILELARMRTNNLIGDITINWREAYRRRRDGELVDN